MTVSLRDSCRAMLAGLALFAAGCGNTDSIQTYDVPKKKDREPAATPVGEYRLLGAMFPATDPQWFFKFTGRTEEIAKFEGDFDKILASVKLPAGGGPPEVTLPDGWKRGGPRGGIVVETLIPPQSSLEVTITGAIGGAAGNVDRWVRQIGLQPGPDDMKKYTKTVEAAGVAGLRVDMSGPKNPATKRGGK
jgi:hypothetical protein